MNRDPAPPSPDVPNDNTPRCHKCGARVYGNAGWCSQCFARVSPMSRGPGLSARAPAAAGHTVYRQAPPASRPAPSAAVAPPYAPAYSTVPPPPLPGPDLVGPSRAIDAAVARTAGAVVALNVLMQVGIFTWARVRHVESEKAIKWALFLSLVFYGVTYLLVAARLQRSNLRILWRHGRQRGAGRVGIAAGVATFLAALGVGYLINHRVALDPTAVLLVGGNAGVIVVAFGLMVLVAPWIEELLFRGLILETLRYRGTKTAVVVSSILFSLFHLRPGFIYYTAIGLVLAAVYVKRGLKSSFFAHAAFNGCIVLTALAMTIGPARVVPIEGLTLQVPRTWNATYAPDVPGGPDAGLQGPSGAVMFVGHESIPLNVAVDAAKIADAMNAGHIPIVGMTLDGSVTPIDLPIGPAVRAPIRADGHAGEIVVVPVPGRVWTLVLMTGGSSRALNDFHRMLRTLTLSAAA